jgi:hypothetical protein
LLIASRHVVLLRSASIDSLAGTFGRYLSFSANSREIPANDGPQADFCRQGREGRKGNQKLTGREHIIGLQVESKLKPKMRKVEVFLRKNIDFARSVKARRIIS